MDEDSHRLIDELYAQYSEMAEFCRTLAAEIDAAITETAYDQPSTRGTDPDPMLERLKIELGLGPPEVPSQTEASGPATETPGDLSDVLRLAESRRSEALGTIRSTMEQVASDSASLIDRMRRMRDRHLALAADFEESARRFLDRIRPR